LRNGTKIEPNYKVFSSVDNNPSFANQNCRIPY
jgi:hypothetical protein